MAMIGVSTFLFVTFLVLALTYKSTERRVAVQSRIEGLSNRHDSSPNRKKSRTRKAFVRNNIGWLGRLEAILKRADIKLEAKAFFLRWICIVAGLTLFSLVFFGVVGAIMTCFSGYLITYLYIRKRGMQRIRRFNDGLYDLLVMVSNSLGAGHSFIQSIQVVSQETTGPIQEEFQRIQSEIQLGIGLEEALLRANGRVESADFDLIVTAILIQKQVGGNLAEVLQKIAGTIQERVKLAREVKALTSQGRLSGLIFMLLPIGVGMILFFINPTYISVLFQTPLGIAMLLIAALGQGIGYVFIRKIVHIDL